MGRTYIIASEKRDLLVLWSVSKVRASSSSAVRVGERVLPPTLDEIRAGDSSLASRVPKRREEKVSSISFESLAREESLTGLRPKEAPWTSVAAETRRRVREGIIV